MPSFNLSIVQSINSFLYPNLEGWSRTLILPSRATFLCSSLSPVDTNTHVLTHIYMMHRRWELRTSLPLRTRFTRCFSRAFPCSASKIWTRCVGIYIRTTFEVCVLCMSFCHHLASRIVQPFLVSQIVQPFFCIHENRVIFASSDSSSMIWHPNENIFALTRYHKTQNRCVGSSCS